MSALKLTARMSPVTSCEATASRNKISTRSGLRSRLHTTPGIPQHMHPVVALVTAGVEMMCSG